MSIEQENPSRPERATEKWVWIVVAMVVGTLIVVTAITVTARNAIDDTADDVINKFEQISSEL